MRHLFASSFFQIPSVIKILRFEYPNNFYSRISYFNINTNNDNQTGEKYNNDYYFVESAYYVSWYENSKTSLTGSSYLYYLNNNYDEKLATDSSLYGINI